MSARAAPSIPVEVLMQIEAHRPDLTPLIHELAIASDPDRMRALERRLAGASALEPEQAWMLSACLDGRPYGEAAKGRFH